MYRSYAVHPNAVVMHWKSWPNVRRASFSPEVSWKSNVHSLSPQDISDTLLRTPTYFNFLLASIHVIIISSLNTARRSNVETRRRESCSEKKNGPSTGSLRALSTFGTCAGNEATESVALSFDGRSGLLLDAACTIRRCFLPFLRRSVLYVGT